MYISEACPKCKSILIITLNLLRNIKEALNEDEATIIITFTSQCNLLLFNIININKSNIVNITTLLS